MVGFVGDLFGLAFAGFGLGLVGQESRTENGGLDRED